jgi:hypothetical protein
MAPWRWCRRRGDMSNGREIVIQGSICGEEPIEDIVHNLFHLFGERTI